IPKDGYGGNRIARIRLPRLQRKSFRPKVGRIVPPCQLRYDSPSYRGKIMRRAKIAVTIDQDLLSRLDGLVKERRFPNRSRAVQEALRDKFERLDRGRLARECAKLDKAFEQRLADEGLAEGLEQWPEY